MLTLLNLGCGTSPIASTDEIEATNLDKAKLPGVDTVFDLELCDGARPLPYRDDTFDEIHANHVAEHLRSILPIFQELHRVAKPDALLTVTTPYGSSDDAWGDPTHVRPWYTDTLKYFDARSYWRADYGYRGDWNLERVILRVPIDRVRSLPNGRIFELVQYERNVVAEMVAELRAVKPARQAEGLFQWELNVELDVFEAAA